MAPATQSPHRAVTGSRCATASAAIPLRSPPSAPDGPRLPACINIPTDPSANGTQPFNAIGIVFIEKRQILRRGLKASSYLL